MALVEENKLDRIYGIGGGKPKYLNPRSKPISNIDIPYHPTPKYPTARRPQTCWARIVDHLNTPMPARTFMLHLLTIAVLCILGPILEIPSSLIPPECE
jgi:hypothetical protein